MRDLRSRKAEDVIFSGSPKRKPASLAEVILRFNNETGWLPVESSEVELTRRLYRSAESEYVLNGQRVRLRDIVDVVREGGLDAGGHTIVGQGMVDSVLSLRGVERRGFIAAVAGIAPYEARRNEAISRLGQTRDNVTRAQIVYDEMQPRLRLLRRQANVTRNALTARTELASALQWHYQRVWSDVQGVTAACEQALAEGDQSVHTLRRQINILQQEREETQGLVDAARRDSQSRRDRVLAADYQLKRARDLEAQRVEDLKRIEGEQSRLRDRLASLETSARLEAGLAGAESTIPGFKRRLLQLKEEIDAQSQLREENGRSRTELAEEKRQALVALAKLTRARDEVERTLFEARRDAEGRDLRRVEVEDRLPELRRVLETAQAERSEIETESDHARSELSTLRAARDQAAAAAAEARALMAKAISTSEALTQAVEDAQTQLAELTRLRSAKASGPTLIETVQVPAHFAAALAASLGGLTDAPATPAQDGPGIRPAPVPARDWQEVIVKRLGVAGIAIDGWLSDLAALDSADSPIRAALASTVVVRSADDLTPAWEAVAELAALTIGHPPLRLVDRSGMIRSAFGVDVAPAGAQQSVRRELAIGELEKHLVDLAASAADADGERADVARTSEERALHLKETEASFEQRNAHAATLVARLAGCDERVRRIEGEVAACVETLSELERRAEQGQAGVTETEVLAHAASSRVLASEAAVAALDNRIVAMALEGRAVEDAIRDLRSEQLLLERQLDLEERELERLAGLAESLEEETRDLVARIEACESMRVSGLQSLQEVIASRVLAEQELLEATADADNAPAESLPDAEALSRQIQELHQKVEEAVESAQRERSRREHLVETAARIENDCLLDLNLHPSAIRAEEPERNLSEVEIRRLRIHAEQAEDIDPGITEEYEELRRRRETLEEQLEDLREAATELESMLRDADREVRRRFRMTFSHVNDLFGMFFRQIFDGGSAELSYETVDDIESVEIVAQLPGKKARDLSGLSGGERTLVAGAFLFSLLSAAPPPFCVLDEVDAALDESNVDRYLGVLKGLAEQTQFVVVTHNRATMAAANTLYGIVLDPEAGSRALSLRLDEAVAG
jgi:chromosome segregation protein